MIAEKIVIAKTLFNRCIEKDSDLKMVKNQFSYGSLKNMYLMFFVVELSYKKLLLNKNMFTKFGSLYFTNHMNLYFLE